MSEERTRATLFLERLPDRILRDFVRRYRKRFGLRCSVARPELIRQVVDRVPIDVVEELYAQYEDAGNVTTFLYGHAGGLLNKVRNIQDLNHILMRVGLGSQFRHQEKVKLKQYPQPVFFDVLSAGKRRIKTRFEYVGESMPYRDPETRELKVISPLRTVVSVLHLASGFLEVRTRDQATSTRTIRVLYRLFGGRFKKLKFSRQHLGQWIEWAKTLRNARFRPLTGVLSSLWMTARRDLDLRQEKTFREWWTRGEPVSGIYVQFEHRRGQVVGFGINAQLGKLFFRSFASEDVITLVVAEAERILAA